MYCIYRNNSRFNNKFFFSYEEARRYVRKLLRSDTKAVKYATGPTFDVNRTLESNANISEYGFKIKTATKLPW